MREVHLVVCDLFLPADIAAEVCAGLRLPALEKMLARSVSTGVEREAVSGGLLENHLCELFGVPFRPAAPVAPLSAAYDGLGEGCWLRADPVHLRLQRDQLVLLPDVEASADDATQLCAALNKHFARQGMEFFAPHPERWYVRLDQLPEIETVPLSQAAGRNVRGLLPAGAGARYWHGVFNEAQMLLFAHPVNEAREARGELPINSLWFWGGGCSSAGTVLKTYDSVSSDGVLAAMFANAAGVPVVEWPAGKWREANGDRQLLVWTGLRDALEQADLSAWREALQGFETGSAEPLWQALRTGEILRLRIDILGGGRVKQVVLTRADTWAFWRRAKPLAAWSRA